MRYITACGMIAATLLIIFLGNARANPPPALWTGSFHLPMVICKTGDQVKQLVEAQKVSDEKVSEVTKTLGDNCNPAYVYNVVVGKAEDLGVVQTGATHEHLWLVPIGTSKATFFGLYEEKVDEGDPA